MSLPLPISPSPRLPISALVRVSALPFLLLLSVALPSSLNAQPSTPAVVAYVPNWIDLEKFSDTIAYDKVTHLNVAFENPTNDAGDLSFNDDDAKLIEKAHAHGVKVLVSIGGGSASEDKKLLKRYATLLGTAHRDAFVSKLSAYVTGHGFDGLDVDLEGPAIIPDYGAFIEALAATLHKSGKLITGALSQGYGGDKVPESALQRFDLVHLMAYDGTGPWDKKAPGQHSSMEMAKEQIAYWLKRGLPREKMTLGLPFYGYGFGKDFKKDEYPYATILKLHPGAETADQCGDTIWYNGIPTIRAKTRLALDQKLAGVMIWSLDSDARGEKSLLGAIDDEIRKAAK